MTHTPPTFKANDTSSWKKHLEEEGFAVIENVLPSEELPKHIETFKFTIAV